MMLTETQIKRKWQKEKPRYEEFGKQIKNEVETLLKEIGINGELSFRTKEATSLVKKTYSKGKTYSDIHDKVGTRAIVPFRENLQKLDERISIFFGERIKNRDDKSTTLSEYEFGYQSIHYDIQDTTSEMYCELQIRTICQHNWSTMSHILSYKKEKNIPVEVKRQINALSALFEVADTQFQSICDAVSRLPEDHVISVYRWLEEHFFKMSQNPYDHEMTKIIIDNLSTLYVDENILKKLTTFYDNNKEKLRQKISSTDSNIFYSQPEIIVILERLENKKILFKSIWSKLYPLELLNDIALVWGCSIE